MTSAQHLYLEHFGLKEAPFKITPTTEFFYSGGKRGEILHALQYAINVGEGIIMITGEVGSGKTMMLRALMQKLDDNIDIIYITNPSLSGREILYHICEDLGLHADPAHRSDTVRLLQNELIERHGENRKVIAFIDEAQAMPDESLEEVRLLSNLETSRDKLLQIALFGQPELEDKISNQNMRQLRERITVKLKLHPFGRDDVREYIATRLRAAGYNGAPIFSKDACRLIANISQGLSRRINVLADKALLSASARGSLTVNYDDARRAVKDVNFGKMQYRAEKSRHLSKRLTSWTAVAACAVLALAVVAYYFNQSSPAAVAAVETVKTAAPTAPGNVATADPIADNLYGNDGNGGISPATQIGDNDNNIDNSDNFNVDSDNTYAASATVTPEVAMETALQQSQVVVMTQTVIVQNVVVTATSPARAATPQLSQTQKRQQIIAAIKTHDNASLTGDELARQLRQNAEPQADAPQARGGNDTWHNSSSDLATAATATANGDNRWNWMPQVSYLRNRLNATQVYLAGNGGSRQYTARLLTVAQSRAVFLEKLLRYFADFYPIRNVMIYPIRLDNGDKFVVTYGIYESREDADVFITNIPYYFTGGRPYSQQLTDSLKESDY